MTIPINSTFPYNNGDLINRGDWNTLISMIVSVLTDGTYDFNVGSITAVSYNNLPGAQFSVLQAGEALSKGNIVRLDTSTGKLYKADNSTLAGVTNILGISIAAYSANDYVTVETNTFAQFAGLTLGLYYVGLAGAPSATRPTSGYVKILGVAYSSTTIKLFNDLFENRGGNPAIINVTTAGITALSSNDQIITMKVAGSGGPVTITANPQITAGWNGQILILTGTSDTNTVTIATGTGLILDVNAGTFILGNNCTIIFKYDATATAWIEITRMVSSL